MLETFQRENARDFRQRYVGSYGYYTDKEADKRILVFMNDVGDGTAHFVDSRDAAYVAKADAGVMFEFLPVTKKVFVYKDKLFYIARKPARMWSRGVNQANTLLMNLAANRQITPSFPYIEAAFDTTPLNVEADVKDIERGERTAVVLSSMFGITGSSLYLYDSLIGSWIADRREILLDQPLFRQEVEDLVERHSLNYKTSVKNA